MSKRMAAMATSGSNQRDHLSDLPEALLLTILSLLPTHMAAQTSILSHRFRYLWHASPSLNLICRGQGIGHAENFFYMARHALVNRNPSYPLINVHLNLFHFQALSANQDAVYISCLLIRAHSLGLNHLTIVGFSRFSSATSVIFSMHTLKSLSLDGLDDSPTLRDDILPSLITLTSLRSLSLQLCMKDPAILSLLISKLCSLKDLQLHLSFMSKVRLSSRTVTKLKLTLHARILDTVEVFLPSLESLHLKTEGPHKSMFHFHGEVPLLKKAVIALNAIHAKDVGAVHHLLNRISHVEELDLHLKESGDEKCPIPILLEPGKDAPIFFNLKHLNVTACFHGHNIEAVVTMLHHSPALESLNLLHEVPKFTCEGRGRKRKDWGSKLPRNDDGNYRYAYVKNLHVGDNRKVFMESICMKLASKRQARNLLSR